MYALPRPPARPSIPAQTSSRRRIRPLPPGIPPRAIASSPSELVPSSLDARQTARRVSKPRKPRIRSNPNPVDPSPLRGPGQAAPPPLPRGGCTLTYRGRFASARRRLGAPTCPPAHPPGRGASVFVSGICATSAQQGSRGSGRPRPHARGPQQPRPSPLSRPRSSSSRSSLSSRERSCAERCSPCARDHGPARALVPSPSRAAARVASRDARSPHPAGGCALCQSPRVTIPARAA